MFVTVSVVDVRDSLNHCAQTVLGTLHQLNDLKVFDSEVFRKKTV